MEEHALNWELDYGNHFEQGARKEQQDFFASFQPDMSLVRHSQGFLALVADGMGGHAGGAMASVIAVKAFMEEYKQRKYKDETIPEVLERALLKANDVVVSENEHTDSDMGTTLVACVLKSNKLYWASVGDSSLFLYRDGKLKKINADHSYGAELDGQRRAGITRHEERSQGRNRNMLTSYLGIERLLQKDIPQMATELKAGDKILLCSDGLTNAMSNAEIEFGLQGERSAQEKCEFLIQQALKKQLPKQDNVTAVLLELKETPAEPEAKPKWGPVELTALIVACVLAIVLLVGLFLNREKIKEKIFDTTPITTEVPKTGNDDPEKAPSKQIEPKKSEDNHTPPVTKPTDTPIPQTKNTKPAPPPRPTSTPTIAPTPTPSPTPSFEDLKEEEDYYLIIRMQVVLRNLKDLNGTPYYSGTVDNDPGPETSNSKTRRGLKQFQKLVGTKQTGVLDEKTYKAFLEYFERDKNDIDDAIRQYRSDNPEAPEPVKSPTPEEADPPGTSPETPTNTPAEETGSGHSSTTRAKTPQTPQEKEHTETLAEEESGTVQGGTSVEQGTDVVPDAQPNSPEDGQTGNSPEDSSEIETQPSSEEQTDSQKLEQAEDLPE